MKSNTVLSILIFLLIVFNNEKTMAQDSTDLNHIEKYKYGIGGGAGFATGYGLSFRYIPKKLGAQINFAPFKNSETERYSLGVTFLYLLQENKNTNFYLYQANHYYYNNQTIYTYNPNNPGVEEKSRSTEDYFNNGLGFGIEIILAKKVGLNLMAGYAFYDNFKQLNVTGELALYYKF